MNKMIDKFKLSTLKRDLSELKDMLNIAVKDETEAKTLYGEIANSAMRAELGNIAGSMRSILGQESQHADIIRKHLKDIEAAEGKIKRWEEELKREEELEGMRESLGGGRHRGALPGRNMWGG